MDSILVFPLIKNGDSTAKQLQPEMETGVKDGLMRMISHIVALQSLHNHGIRYLKLTST